MAEKPKSEQSTILGKIINQLENPERGRVIRALNENGFLYLIRYYFRGDPLTYDSKFIFTNLDDKELFETFLNFVIVSQKNMTRIINDYKSDNVSTDDIKFISPCNKQDGCDIHSTINALLLCRYKNNFTINSLNDAELSANDNFLDRTKEKLIHIYNEYYRFRTVKETSIEKKICKNYGIFRWFENRTNKCYS